MDIQKLKNYASKHKMKVALGTTMAAALIAGASVGTYAYFKAQYSANSTLTLKNGSVNLEKYKDEPEWEYLGNSVNLLWGTHSYLTETKINPDLTNNEFKTIRKCFDDGSFKPKNEKDTEAKLFKGKTFSNVVPGDTFRKEYIVEYTGRNEADVTLKLVDGQKKVTEEQTRAYLWENYMDYYDLKIEYYIVNTTRDEAKNALDSANFTTLIDTQTEKSTVTKLQELKDKGEKFSMSPSSNFLYINVYYQMKNKDYKPEEVANLFASDNHGQNDSHFSIQNNLIQLDAKNKLYQVDAVGKLKETNDEKDVTERNTVDNN